MSAICLQCYVSGLVQGVFFRRETCEQAKTHGLKGFVRNLPDGRVEVLVCGEKEKVDEMVDWLWEGPERAQVSNVEIREIPNSEQSLANFEVR